MSNRPLDLVHSIEPLEPRRLLDAALVADADGIYPKDAVTIDGISYFVADDETHGRELWRSDGTIAGTRMVKDITPGKADSTMSRLRVVNNLIFVIVQDDHTNALVRSDGTPDGTFAVASFDTSQFTIGDRLDHGQYWFEVNPQNVPDPEGKGLGSQLWASDGTIAGTRIVKDLTYATTAAPRSITRLLPVAGNHLAMTLSDYSLWVSDGSDAGTVSLASRLGESPEVFDHKIDAFGNSVIFTSRSAVWRSDGTLAGTVQVAGLKTPTDRYPSANSLRVIEGRAFIDWHRNDANQALVVTDGSSRGTKIIGEITFGLDIASATTISGGEWLFMNGWEGESAEGAERWVSDGTSAGTHLLKDINPGEHSSNPSQYIQIGNVMYFAADDGVHGRQIWRSDGTAAGTMRVTNVDYDPAGAIIRLAEVNGKIAMSVEHHVDGQPIDPSKSETFLYEPADDAAPIGPAQSALRLDGGRLRITGTFGDDVIKFYRMSDGQRFSVSINGAPKRTFRFDHVARIIVYSYSGDDTIIVNEQYGIFKERLFVWGGGGDDVIWTGSAVDRVVGGDGNDTIRTGRGDDTLVGGNGDDRLVGGTGQDLVSGGAGGDWLDPGSGSDVLFGQPVYDVFYCKRDNDGEVVGDDDALVSLD